MRALSFLCRRSVLRTRRVVTATLATAIGLAMSGLAEAAQVDLILTAANAITMPGGRTSIALRVGNDGASGATPVQLTVTTPPYVNFDRAIPLPVGCVFLYQNPDRVFSEIVACTLPALTAGERRSISLAIEVDVLAPSAGIVGAASVLPVAGGDTDIDLVTNHVTLGVIVGRTTLANGSVNLAVMTDTPALGAPTPTVQAIVVQNNGPSAARGPIVLGFYTPSFTNIDRLRPLPLGCSLLFANLNPGVPEIVSCSIANGLAVGESRRFDVPLALVSGAPPGALAGAAAVRVNDASGDADPDRADNATVSFVTALERRVESVAGTGVAVTTARIASAAPEERSSRPATGADTVPPERDDTRMPAWANGRPDGPRSAATSGGARVDLYAVQTAPPIRPGDAGLQPITIGNSGEDATGRVQAIYVLPLYTNIDRQQPLPGPCTFLYEDLDFTVHEIVSCTMPGPARGQTIQFDMPVEVAADAPHGRQLGQLIVRPAPDSRDVELFFQDNLTTPQVLVLPGGQPPPAGHPVDLYLTSDVRPNVLTNRPGTQTLIVTNNGPDATQGATRLTFTTPPFVNIDRARPLPVGCAFLYENPDPVVPEIVECRIAAGMLPNDPVRLPIPVRLTPGAPSGRLSGHVFVRPLAGSPDVEQTLVDNLLWRDGVAASILPAHVMRFYLHMTDIPGTAGGFTMNSTPAPALLSVNLLNAPRWFSDPPLVGTFDEAARFRIVMPCLLGLAVSTTYRLATTAPDGSSELPLGEVTAPVSLCLGQQTVAIPVLTPASLDGRRLKLTIQTLLGLNLPLGASTYLEGTQFRGTP